MFISIRKTKVKDCPDLLKMIARDCVGKLAGFWVSAHCRRSRSSRALSGARGRVPFQPS